MIYIVLAEVSVLVDTILCGLGISLGKTNMQEQLHSVFKTLVPGSGSWRLQEVVDDLKGGGGISGFHIIYKEKQVIIAKN